MDTYTRKGWKGLLAVAALYIAAVGSLSAQTPNFPSVKDYGAVGDGITDDLPAFNAAITSSILQNGFVYPVRGTVIVPPGTYFLNGTIVLNNEVHLMGGSSGQSGGNWASTLKFPPNTTGIRLIKGNVNPNRNGADGTIIDGIRLLGGGGNNTASHGLDVQARMKLRDSCIMGFAGNGVNIQADVWGPDRSNANCWVLDTVLVTGNAGHGVYTQGGDSNAGSARSVEASNNGGWGIYDSSFLGNTYVGCYTSGNGLGAYKTSNPNARNAFLGCVSESGQPASDVNFPATVLGGSHRAGVGGSGYFLIDGENPSVWAVNSSETASIRLGEDAAGALVTLAYIEAPHPYRLKYTTGKWLLDWANLAEATHLELYNRAATPANGFARDLSDKNGGLGLPSGFYGGGMRFRGEASAAPTSGAWLQGDFLYQLSPVAGGYVGWVCIAGGSPGTWKQFGSIQP